MGESEDRPQTRRNKASLSLLSGSRTIALKVRLAIL